jgi:hypothetical protein
MKRLSQLSPAFLVTMSCLLLSTATGNSQCVPHPSNLRLWYALDETSVSPGVKDIVSGVVSPLAPNLQGSPTNAALVNGVRHNAIFIDSLGHTNPGAAGYFLAYNSPALNFGTTTNFSIDFYIYDMKCGVPVPETGGRTACYNAWMGTSDKHSGWEIVADYNQSTLQLNVYQPSNPGQPITLAAVTYPLYTWTHVTFTVDRTGAVETYLDGIPQNPGVSSVPSNTINLSTSPLRPVIIGGTYASGGLLPPDQGARGYLDEIEIFDRVLTPDEVLNIATPTIGKCKPPSATAKGMTWERRAVNATNGTVTVGCLTGTNGCNPYFGDRLCSISLPLLCFKPSNFPVPTYVNNASLVYRWSGGIVGTTAPVAASSFGGSLLSANARCVQEFGAGWRVAEFHDGWYWNFQAYGNVGTLSNRFWVHINGMPNARCWN